MLRFKNIIIVVIVFITPLLVIKFFYPRLGFDHEKFSEEYLKLLGGAVIGILLGIFNNIFSKTTEFKLKQIENRNRILETLNEYSSFLSQLKDQKIFSSDAFLSKAFTANRNNILAIETRLKEQIYNDVTSIFHKNQKNQNEIRILKEIMDKNNLNNISIDSLRKYILDIEPLILKIKNVKNEKTKRVM
jgi:hypothetical protein